jgi:hypothetical protein
MPIDYPVYRCEGCGAVVWDQALHVADHRRRMMKSEPKQTDSPCSEKSKIYTRGSRNHFQAVVCGVEGEHDEHRGLLEGLVFRWKTPKPEFDADEVGWPRAN